MNRFVCAVLLVFCLSGVAAAQDRDLRSGNLPPRTGLVSEEVARQKLAAVGLVDVQNLRSEGDRWHASALAAGQRIDVEVNALTGLVHQRGRVEPLRPADPSAPAAMRDHSLKMERDEIARVPDAGRAVRGRSSDGRAAARRSSRDRATAHRAASRPGEAAQPVAFGLTRARSGRGWSPSRRASSARAVP